MGILSNVLAITTKEIIEMFSSGVVLGISVYTATKSDKSPDRRRRR